MNYIFLSILLVTSILGKNLIIKTDKHRYLANTQGHKNTKNIRRHREHGSDYQDEIGWIDKCSLKKAGKLIQKDVVGCGGGIEMKCVGGCLKIHKLLYSCEESERSNPQQLESVKEVCDKKEECVLQASRELFGHKECPDTPDSNMVMWIVYSCDGGQDNTRLTGPQSCDPATTVVTTSTTNKPLNNCRIESLSYALDISGSMSGSTSKWKPVAVNLVEEMAKRQVNINRHYLFTYVDTIQQRQITTDYKEFANTIKNWGTYKGSRELTFTAIKHAMEQVATNAFVCVWSDEIGDDTNNAALKADVLRLKASTNSEIFFMAVNAKNIDEFRCKFGDIGYVMDVSNDPSVVSEMIEIMQQTKICAVSSTSSNRKQPTPTCPQ